MKDELRINQLIAEKDLGQTLKISREALQDLRRKGCPWVNLAGKVYYHEAKFMEWLLKNRLKISDISESG